MAENLQTIQFKMEWNNKKTAQKTRIHIQFFLPHREGEKEKRKKERTKWRDPI